MYSSYQLVVSYGLEILQTSKLVVNVADDDAVTLVYIQSIEHMQSVHYIKAWELLAGKHCNVCIPPGVAVDYAAVLQIHPRGSSAGIISVP